MPIGLYYRLLVCFCWTRIQHCSIRRWYRQEVASH